MAGFQRSIGARAIRHADVDSKVHKDDVRQNNERRGLYWLGVEQNLDDGHREVPELGGGLYYVRDPETGNLMTVDGPEHTVCMDAWHADLTYYLREVVNKKGGKRWKKTPTKGVQGHVVTCSPWWSNVIYEAAQKGEHEKVLEFAEKAAVELAHTFQRQTKRRVLSVQAHFDTTSMHWHLFSTRIGPDHKLIPKTTKAIGLVGPWCVGVLRQSEVGAIPADSINLMAARRLFARNEERMGSAPIDYQMAKVIDGLCQAMFGTSPRLAWWLRVYRRGLLGMCVDRLTALRDATDREIVRYKAGADYVHTEVGFGSGVNGGTEVTLH